MLTPNIDLQNKSILITGAAGFIGANLVMELLRDTDAVKVVGLDSMSDYYDVSIKEYRLAEIDKMAKQTPENQWIFVKGSIADRALLERLFQEHCFDLVFNLAAQAGVRYSITNPDAYIESNLVGFYNILEACRRHPVAHLVYASSSSVYGTNRKVPYAVNNQVDTPVSLYAATKKSNELMAHAYSKLYSKRLLLQCEYSRNVRAGARSATDPTISGRILTIRIKQTERTVRRILVTSACK